MTDAIDATLAAALWPTRRSLRFARDAALAVGGALALAVSAKIQVPFTPVPMTLQTLVVLALGAAYGSRLAAATVGLYLLEGLLGLPVFAGALAGPAYMVGPTGGFLAGFLVAAALVGRACRTRLGSLMGLAPRRDGARPRRDLRARLRLARRPHRPGNAFAYGVAPFALATIVKTLLACALVGAAWSALDRAPRL